MITEILYVAGPDDEIPDPTPGVSIEEFCEQLIRPAGGITYGCTMPTGHAGAHMASSSERVEVIWRETTS